MARRFALVSALGFLVLLAALTIFVLVTSGPDVLVLLSLVVVACFTSGVVGALRHPPE